MFRTQHALGACLVVIASVIALAHGAEPSSAAAPCDQRVLADWSDNGRIDGIYPLGCYEEAIAALPLDLRDYTNAEEIIGRALTNAVRRSPASVPSDDADRDAGTRSDGARQLVFPACARARGRGLARAGRRRWTRRTSRAVAATRTDAGGQSGRAR